MSAKMSNLVTSDRSERAARTMAPRFVEEHGSSANSTDATRICSPETKINTSTHNIIEIEKE